ncbi:unnamed protein product [Lactuca virosa]|uniref:Uncharacterized protein n=1 Tax=Lactuca virosa TaxID=75947 RepID=A0AAU9N542_9ASTR|nr:unnamed protein product [Lactuca virosa]
MERRATTIVLVLRTIYLKHFTVSMSINNENLLTFLKYIDNLREIQNALVGEIALQTPHITDSGGDLNSIDWITIFVKVLGARRGHVIGIRPKPPSATGTSAPSQWQSHSHTQAPQPT